jgi:hypothetical protein
MVMSGNLSESGGVCDAIDQHLSINADRAAMGRRTQQQLVTKRERTGSNRTYGPETCRAGLSSPRRSRDEAEAAEVGS